MKRISLFILSIVFFVSLCAKEIGNFKLTEESDTQYIINFTIDNIELKIAYTYINPLEEDTQEIIDELNEDINETINEVNTINNDRMKIVTNNIELS